MKRRSILATAAIASLSGCSTLALEPPDTVTQRDESMPFTDRLVGSLQAWGVDARSSTETYQGYDLVVESDGDYARTVIDLTAVALVWAELEPEEAMLAVMFDGESPLARTTIMSSWAADFRAGDLTLVEYIEKIDEQSIMTE